MRRLTRGLLILFAALCACLAHAPARAQKPEGENVRQTDEAARLWPVVSRMKWGFMDRTGKVVIEPKYDMEPYFSDGVAVVRTLYLDEAAAKHNPEGNFIVTPVKGVKWEIIDAAGKALATLPAGRMYESSFFREGLASFAVWWDAEGGYYGFMDKAGKVVIEPRFRSHSFFQEGRAGVCERTGKCGFIDRAGKYVVRPRYREVLPFSEGFAAVSLDGETAGFVDRTGATVIAPLFRMNAGLSFNEGLAPAAFAGSDKYGYIDKLGHFRIQPEFEMAGPFSEGLAPVRTGGKFGYIDREGKFVIAPQFTLAWPFSDGLAGATTCPDAQHAPGMREGEVPEPCGEAGFIDKSGRFVIRRVEPATTVNRPNFRDGVAEVFVDGYRTYINREGKILWQLKPDAPEAAP